MGLAVVFLVICAMLIANAFYVAAEFAAVSASKPKLEAQADDGSSEAKYLVETITDEDRIDRYIACAQVGITLSSLVIGVYGQRALMPYLGPVLKDWLPAGWAGAAVMAPLILLALTSLQVIFGELFPKSIAVRSPERVARLTAAPMRWSLLVLRPFIWLLNGSAMLILRAFGMDKPSEEGDEHSHEELRQIIAASLKGGEIERSSHEMLRQVLAFRERTVREVMEPRVRMKTLDAEMRAEAALARVLTTGFTRFPVTTGDETRPMEGFVHIRDLHELYERDPEAGISEIVRPIRNLPETLTLAEVWRLLQEDDDSLAVLYNEYGTISGMVSLEDLIEEIVGEVVDEFDDEEPRIRHRGDRIVIRGDLPVSEVNRKLDLDLPEDKADTMAGLVGLKLGVESSRRRAKLEIGGTVFTVDSVENDMPRLISFSSDAVAARGEPVSDGQGDGDAEPVDDSEPARDRESAS